ncbi:HEAT repeat domain-containing protein [bacterium]|nr:HEAT repeat domain-containing protein [bacterium]
MTDLSELQEIIQNQTAETQIDAIYKLAQKADGNKLEAIFTLYEKAIHWITDMPDVVADSPGWLNFSENSYAIITAIRDIVSNLKFPISHENETILLSKLEQESGNLSDLALLALGPIHEKHGKISNPTQSSVQLTSHQLGSALEFVSEAFLVTEQKSINDFEQVLSSVIKRKLETESEEDGLRSYCEFAVNLNRFGIPERIYQLINVENPALQSVILKLILKFASIDITRRTVEQLLTGRHFLSCPQWLQIWIVKAISTLTTKESRYSDLVKTAFRSPYANVRILALQLFASGLSFPELKDLSQDSNALCRKEVYRVLGDSGLKKAATFLQHQLNLEKGHPLLQNEILRQLNRFEDQKTAGARFLFGSAMIGSFASTSVKVMAVRLFLPYLPAEEAFSLLLTAFESNEEEMIRESAELISSFDIVDFINFIFLNTKTISLKAIRNFVIYAKSNILPKELTKRLMDELENQKKSEKERLISVSLLALSNTKESAKIIVDEIRRYDRKNKFVEFSFLLECLGKTESPVVIKDLISWIENENLNPAQKKVVVNTLMNFELSKSHVNKLFNGIKSLQSQAPDIVDSVMALIIHQPLQSCRSVVLKIATGKNDELKQHVARVISSQPDIRFEDVYACFVVNNPDHHWNYQILNAISKISEASVSENIADLLRTKGSDDSSLSDFVNGIDGILSNEEKIYFQESLYADETISFKDCLAEFCLNNPIERFLAEFLSQKQLADLLKKKNTNRIFQTKDEFINAVLKSFNLQRIQEPPGVYHSLRRVKDLQQLLAVNIKSLEYSQGIVMEAFAIVERLCWDLLDFYTNILFGDENYLPRLKSGFKDKKDLDFLHNRRLTFGKIIESLRRLGYWIRNDDIRQKTFYDTFARNTMIDKELLSAMGEIVEIRNGIVHPKYEESEHHDPLRVVFETAIAKITAVISSLAEKKNRYPNVISIDRYVSNHYGIKYWICRMDGPIEPVQKLIITEKELNPKNTYFMIPRDSKKPSTIFYPILILKENYQ